MIEMLKSKIHRAVVTGNLEYRQHSAIPRLLKQRAYASMKRSCDLNRRRFETYVVKAKKFRSDMR